MAVTDSIFTLPAPPPGNAVYAAFVEAMTPDSAVIVTESAGGFSIAGTYELNPKGSVMETASAGGVVLSSQPPVTDSIFVLPAPPSGDSVDAAFIELVAPHEAVLVVESFGDVPVTGTYELYPRQSAVEVMSADGITLTIVSPITESLFLLHSPPAGDAVNAAFVELIAPHETAAIITVSRNIGGIEWAQGIAWSQGIEWVGGAAGMYELRHYDEVLASAAAAASGVVDLARLAERVTSVAQMMADARDRQTFVENVAIAVLATGGVEDAAAYAEEVGSVVMSGASADSLLRDVFIGRYMFLDMVPARRFDGMVPARTFADTVPRRISA